MGETGVGNMVQEAAELPATLPPEPLPLAAWHRAHGARMVPFAGYEMPLLYDTIVKEHLWTRGHAGLFDVSHMGQLRFTSEAGDPAAALEQVLPGSIAGLAPGEMRYSFLLDEDGGILDDLIAAREADGAISMVVNGATKWDDIGWLRENLPDEVTITHLADQAMLALQGPDAAAVLAGLVPAATSLAFMHIGTFAWRGHVIAVSRSGYTGEDGFEISLDAEAAEEMADALAASEMVRPAGLGARDSLRLEAGLPLYSHDLDTTTDPIGAGLGFAIPGRRREEGGFIGHGAIRQVLEHGPARKRVGLLLEGRQPAREGAVIHSGGDAIGRVTSGGFSPTLECPIAMGYVHAGCAQIGREVGIEVRGRLLPARLVPLPFVPHRYHRQGG